MKLTSLWAFFFLLACSVRADEPPAKLPVSIKAVQVADKLPETIRFEVANSSASTVIVDKRRFEEPGYSIAKDVTPRSSSEVKELCIDRIGVFSTNAQRPALNQRPRPDWLVSIRPGQSFTIEIPAHKLLHDVDKRFLQGEIKVVFSVCEFLLAVDGKETDRKIFRAACESNELTIRWH